MLKCCQEILKKKLVDGEVEFLKQKWSKLESACV